MTAPPNKQKINALTVARLKPADKPFGLGHLAARARHPYPADRRARLEGHL